MLRECHRVLKPDGVLAGYIIHTPPGLTPAQEQEALDLGPSAVGADGSPADMATEAGFREVGVEDVTDTFLATLDRVISARLSYEARLRELEGDQVFEDEQSEGEGKRRGVLSGLLKRSLIVARK